MIINVVSYSFGNFVTTDCTIFRHNPCEEWSRRIQAHCLFDEHFHKSQVFQLGISWLSCTTDFQDFLVNLFLYFWMLTERIEKP